MAAKRNKKRTQERRVALSTDEQIAQVRQAVGVDALSFSDAATKLGTTKGAIAGICHRNNIKKPPEAQPERKESESMHQSGLPMKSKTSAKNQSKVRDVAGDSERRPAKTAVSEAVQCQAIVFPNHRCAFEVADPTDPSSKYCVNHGGKKR